MTAITLSLKRGRLQGREGRAQRGPAGPTLKKPKSRRRAGRRTVCVRPERTLRVRWRSTAGVVLNYAHEGKEGCEREEPTCDDKSGKAPGNDRGRKLRPGHFRTRNKIVGILNTEEGRSRARRSQRPQDTTGQADRQAGSSSQGKESSRLWSRPVSSRLELAGGGDQEEARMPDARCQVPDARSDLTLGRLVVGIPELMGRASRDRRQSCECLRRVGSGRVERTCTCRVVEQGDGSDETTGA